MLNSYNSLSFGKRARTAGENTIKTRFEWDNINVKYNVLCAKCLMNGVVRALDTVHLNNLPAPPDVATQPGYPEKILPAGSLRMVSSSGSYSLYFKAPNDGAVRLSLYRVNGALVATVSRHATIAGNGELQLNAGMLARGVYYAHAEAGSASRAKKIIVQ